jgi:tetratricopeptide (TPR) repeat protein
MIMKRANQLNLVRLRQLWPARHKSSQVFFTAILSAPAFLLLSLSELAPIATNRLAIFDQSAAAQTIIEWDNQALADEGDRLLELGKLQRQQGQLSKAIAAWRGAIEYYKQVNDQATIGHTYSLIGDAYVAMNRMESARIAYQKRLHYATTLDVGIGKIAAHNNLGTIAALPGDGVSPAKEYANEALYLSRRYGYDNHQGRAIALNTIGLLEAQRGQHLRAIKLYYRSMPNRYGIWDRQGEAYSLVYSGDSYLALEEYDTAISDYGLALVLAKQTKDLELQALILDRMVSPYLDKFDPNYYRAEDILLERLAIAQTQADRATEAIVYRQLGGLYFFLDLPHKAQPAFQKALEIAHDVNDQTTVREAYLGLETLKRS